MNYVYLIRSEETGRYKIGVSKDPTKRIEQLNTGNDSELVLIESFPSEYAYKVETALQNSYAYTHKRGEWFDLYLENELSFIDNCRKIEENIKYLIKEGNDFI